MARSKPFQRTTVWDSGQVYTYLYDVGNVLREGRERAYPENPSLRKRRRRLSPFPLPRRPRDVYSTFNTARVSGKTYMPGLRFHGDVSAGGARSGRDGALGGVRGRYQQAVRHRESGEVSRLMDYVCQTLVVDACRHDAGHTTVRPLGRHYKLVTSSRRLFAARRIAASRTTEETWIYSRKSPACIVRTISCARRGLCARCALPLLSHGHSRVHR